MNVCKNGKEGKNSPAFAVSASVENGKDCYGGSSLGLCMWAKKSTVAWMGL